MSALPNFSGDRSEREQIMVQAGIDRFVKRRDDMIRRGNAAAHDDYNVVIKRCLLDVADRIESIRSGQSKRRRNEIMKLIEGIPSVTIAYLGLVSVFNKVAIKENDRVKIAHLIGSYLEDESNYHLIKTTDEKLWGRLKRFAEDREGHHYKRLFVFHVARKEGVEKVEWPLDKKVLLGAWVLRQIEVAGVVSIVKNTHDGYTETEVVFSDEMLRWLEERRARGDMGDISLASPIFAPMTEQPVDWWSLYGGGYRSIRIPLIKMGKADYRQADMTKVYRAINLMQRTAWHLNGRMLDIVLHLWSTGVAAGSLPRAKREDVPERLPDAARVR